MYTVTDGSEVLLTLGKDMQIIAEGVFIVLKNLTHNPAHSGGDVFLSIEEVARLLDPKPHSDLKVALLKAKANFQQTKAKRIEELEVELKLLKSQTYESQS